MSRWSEWWKRICSLGKPQSFALNELDRRLEAFLNHDQGVFIEAGANDGIQQSNTLYFERYRGWSGLLVEPIPELAARCRRNRPKCHVAHAALTPRGFPDKQIAMRYCGLMSLVKGGMKSVDEEDQHIATGTECQRLQSYEVQVPAETLSDLWDRYRLDQVDLLSLDVEGFELPALQGLDLNRHRPRWLLIEARYRAEIEAYLGDWYHPEAELSHHDVLYRCKAA